MAPQVPDGYCEGKMTSGDSEQKGGSQRISIYIRTHISDTWRIVHLKFQCVSESLGILFKKTVLSVLVPDFLGLWCEAWASSLGVVVLFDFQNCLCIFVI